MDCKGTIFFLFVQIIFLSMIFFLLIFLSFVFSLLNFLYFSLLCFSAVSIITTSLPFRYHSVTTSLPSATFSIVIASVLHLFLCYICIFDKKVVPLQIEIVCIYINELEYE